MKIHVLPVSKEFQPDRQNYRMPVHGRDWNVERDFHSWLLNHPHLTTARPEEADWDYLPIWFNLLYINWDWGQKGLDRIQNEILRLVSRHRPTFTIVEYDVRSMQPFFDLCEMTVFTASRQRDNGSIDIPLLCSRHEIPAILPEKRHVASFIGNLQTDGLRMEMEEALGSVAHIENGNRGTEHFVDLMLASLIALAPRGHGGQSFRFYEAMDLGVVPYLIGEPDTRPFKRWLDWDLCSLYSPTVGGVSLDYCGLSEMGSLAQDIYELHLRYGKWCRYVLKELDEL